VAKVFLLRIVSGRHLVMGKLLQRPDGSRIRSNIRAARGQSCLRTKISIRERGAFRHGGLGYRAVKYAGVETLHVRTLYALATLTALIVLA
jgi:hypothetical protein